MIHKCVIIYGFSLLMAPIPTLYITGKSISKASKFTYKTVIKLKNKYQSVH